MRQSDCGEGWEGNVAANVMPDIKEEVERYARLAGN